MRRLFHHLLALAAVPLAVSAAAGQKSTLVVHVTDEGGHPLSDARVSVGGVSEMEVTNGRGVARIPGIGDGTRLVQVSRVGYAFARVAADFAGGTVEKTVRMTAQPVEVAGVTATSWGRSMRLRNAGFYDRQRRGFGSFMTGDQLLGWAPMKVSDAFRRMRGFRLQYMVGPGLSGDYVVQGTQGPDGFGSACMPLFFLDGMLITAGNARDQIAAFRLVSPQDVEAIEAYSGASNVPAEYNTTGSACGVILIWTHGGPSRSSQAAAN